MTNDQYEGLSQLLKWYRKYQHQFIEISGVIGTGTWDLVQKFIELESFDSREIMYLSYNQKQVLELAFKKYHAYYINGIIYNYTRIVDFNSMPVINPLSEKFEYEWKKGVKKKIDPRYKLMIIFDSILLNQSTLQDLSSFGIPIILIRDPMLLPAPDTYTFLREANIELHEVNPDYIKSPITYFAHKVLNRERMTPGSYDTVSIIQRKQMNLYNIKSSDMVLTISKGLRDEINSVYRQNILKRKDLMTLVNERMIVMETMYGHRITNHDEKNVKVYLTKGTVGTISHINAHAQGTKYVPIEFKAEFYYEPFSDLVLDRHYLNKIVAPSKQIVPDEVVKMEYAYALTSSMARLSHWDKVTLVIDPNEESDPDLQTRLLYSAITRAKKSITIVI